MYNEFLLERFSLIFMDEKSMTAANKPRPEAIRLQLELILQSVEFRGSNKQRKFLSFAVEETLAGRASQLKGYTIAVEVYGRKEGFDPQTDPIVRLEAGRLRRALEHYYLTAGKNDPLRIEIPKGGYVPAFQTVEIPSSGDERFTFEGEDLALPTGPSIAVLPLINMTGDKDQDYFTDGLTEELTTELCRYQDFQVIASQSTTQFKGQEFDPREIRKALGVQFLLVGSVRWNSKSVKVAIGLLDTSTGAQIWGYSYKGDLTAADLIAMQEDIARRVIGTIADQYGLISRRLSRESRKKPPADLQAYDAVLRFYHYETVLTPEAFKEALEGLEWAVEIDPGYGLAWAMLGHLYADNYALGFCLIDTPLEKAMACTQKAVALAPENQFARDALTLVHFHRGDKELFLKNAEQTIAFNSNSPYVVGVAGWHMALYGEWDRGLALMEKGMKLNPYYPSWFHLAPYMHLYSRGEYENAFNEALKFNYPELFWDPLMRAAALGQMGRENEARAALGELLKVEPDFATRGRLLINRYVKVDDLVDSVVEGLQKAGLADLD
jgi:adenylate cyclase